MEEEKRPGSGVPQEAVTEAAEAVSDTVQEAVTDTAEAVSDAVQETVTGAAETAANQPEQGDPEDEEYTPKDFGNDALDLIGSVLASIFVVIILFAYVFCIADVDGESMLPTLEPGDRLFVMRIGTELERGDIIILDSNKAYTFDANNNLVEDNGLGKRIVKRLIATGGQEVRIDFSEGAVYVDGEKLNEPYISSLTKRDEGAFRYPIVVPEGYVFVLGDNRYISRDSRHPAVGLIPEEDISGEVVCRVSPFSAFGKIE